MFSRLTIYFIFFVIIIFIRSSNRIGSLSYILILIMIHIGSKKIKQLSVTKNIKPIQGIIKPSALITFILFSLFSEMLHGTIHLATWNDRNDFSLLQISPVEKTTWKCLIKKESVEFNAFSLLILCEFFSYLKKTCQSFEVTNKEIPAKNYKNIEIQ